MQSMHVSPINAHFTAVFLRKDCFLAKIALLRASKAVLCTLYSYKLTRHLSFACVSSWSPPLHFLSRALVPSPLRFYFLWRAFSVDICTRRHENSAFSPVLAGKLSFACIRRGKMHATDPLMHYVMLPRRE